MRHILLPAFLMLGLTPSLRAAETAETVESLLKRATISDAIPQAEVEAFCERRVPPPPRIESAAAWESTAERLRQRVLDEVVFRGEAAKWRNAKVRVEWQETIDGGEGYRIKKLRFEALPGLWIPALLYEPLKIEGKVPAVMNVNGHDRNDGKAATYKQLRCINQAKRGMLALNVEWLGMGQLQSDGFGHYRMNQLDLCGTSGLAPFYLAMSRGLDLLLADPRVDPERVAVAGLSGGGWQTIVISALDTRVKLCNPVAGYSSFLTRIHHHSDLGDSEQTPCDLATVADYTHLTAMLAPRAALLTFNIKDQCCFASGHALQPLLDAASPAYRAFEQPDRLRWHINHEPGTHNFEQDNRQALYGMLADHFGVGDAKEIPADGELKTADQLAVELPADNLDFQQLATRISRPLPRAADGAVEHRRRQLRSLLRIENNKLELTAHREPEVKLADGVIATPLTFRINGEWTVPAVMFAKTDGADVAVLVSDQGRQSLSREVAEQLDAGRRVIAVDPFYLGESKIKSRDFLFALLVSAVGERPLGIQSAQLQAFAQWAKRQAGLGAKHVRLVSVGERSGLATLTAHALSDQIDAVDARGGLDSLKQVIERGYAVNQHPELFCFGLLEHFDIPQLRELGERRGD
ncbi:MAG: acetylxylan esterase [Planctomycetales bacterium]|nr:acetylxylan esterase [Planctomycetales bacterium]